MQVDRDAVDGGGTGEGKVKSLEQLCRRPFVRCSARPCAGGEYGLHLGFVAQAGQEAADDRSGVAVMAKDGFTFKEFEGLEIGKRRGPWRVGVRLLPHSNDTDTRCLLVGHVRATSRFSFADRSRAIAAFTAAAPSSAVQIGASRPATTAMK